MRRLDRMNPRKASPSKRNWLVLDIEAKDGMTQAGGFTRPFLVGVFDGQTYQSFRDSSPPITIDDYWSPGGCVDLAMRHLLRREHRGRICYSHFGGRFDFLHLMPWVQAECRREGYQWEILPLSSSLHMLTITQRDGRDVWKFVDSGRLIPVRLSDACNAFEVEHQKLEHDLDMHESDSRWDQYCEHDCRGLWETMAGLHTMVEDRLGGQVGITLPSTSMRLYRARYQKQPIERSCDTHQFVRRGYYGGRVEVFRRHGKKVRAYDINSSYPNVMRQPVPVGKGRWYHGERRPWQDNLVGFVECEVEVPHDLDPPVLPYRHKGRLVFPVGTLRGVWDWAELYEAERQGCTITWWGRSVWYRAEPILKAYVEKLYPLRQGGSSQGLSFTVKRLLNAFYGKFGQHPSRASYTSTRGKAVDCDKTVFSVEEISDADYIIPQIAAHITSLARLSLYRLFMAALDSGGILFYGDTDNCHTTSKLDSSDELGGWKEEYPEHGGRMSGTYLSPKCYYLTDDEWSVSKSKGLQKEHRNVEGLKRLAKGERLYQMRLDKVGTMARYGFSHGPRMVAVPRVWHPDEGIKRRYHEDGTSSPIIITGADNGK